MKTATLATLMALASFSLAAPLASPEPVNSTPETHQLFARETCNTNFQCTLDDAWNAANYFINRGTQKVNTPNGGQWGNIYQPSEGCIVYAYAIGANNAASFARDVGYGIRNLINDCTLNGKVGGNGAAGGNGNFGLALVGDH